MIASFPLLSPSLAYSLQASSALLKVNPSDSPFKPRWAYADSVAFSHSHSPNHHSLITNSDIFVASSHLIFSTFSITDKRQGKLCNLWRPWTNSLLHPIVCHVESSHCRTYCGETEITLWTHTWCFWTSCIWGRDKKHWASEKCQWWGHKDCFAHVGE